MGNALYFHNYFILDFLTETTDRHLLRDVQNQLPCGHLVNILKSLMLISSNLLKSRYSASPGTFLSLQIRADDQIRAHDSYTFLKNAPKDATEMSFQVLKIICSEGWVKEKCLKDADDFVTNMLVCVIYIFFETLIKK